MTKIYHNPRCSKSREALQLLDKRKEKVEIIRYLEHPPDKAELTALIEQLGIKPIQLVRTAEKIWKEQYKNRALSNAEVIAALLKYPILIERPIVVKNGKAVIGRPPESVLTIL